MGKVHEHLQFASRRIPFLCILRSLELDGLGQVQLKQGTAQGLDRLEWAQSG